MEKKTHWRKAFDSDYLASCDIPEGQDLIATIKEVKLEDVKNQQGTSKCNVAYFVEKLKPMVLNVTNSKIVKKFTKSNYIDDWKNVKVQIYVQDNVRMGKEITEGLRLRATQPKSEIDVSEAINKLNSCTSIDELQKAYQGLSRPEQAHKDVVNLKNTLKTQLS